MRKSVKEIAAALGIQADSLPDAFVSRLLTDSRSPFEAEETLFIALSVKGGDGHRFILSLYNKGVRYFVVSRMPEDVGRMKDAHFLLVEDTLEALRCICALPEGSASRRVAIVGSRGKTAVKEWAYLLLSHEMRCMRSPRSFNSQIGVPLTLWNVEGDEKCLFIEAGISQAGEMPQHSRMIRPHAVIVTDMSAEHDEGFSSYEEKVREKLSILDGEDVELAVYPADDPLIDEIVRSKSLSRTAGWSLLRDDADIRFSLREGEGFTDVDYRYGDISGTFRTRFTATYDLRNLLGVIAFMLASGKDPARMQSRILELPPLDTRLAVSEGVNGCRLILDGFTADVVSLFPALDFMKRRADSRQPLALVVSDLEIPFGETPEEVYSGLASLLRIARVGRLIGVGAEISSFRHLFPAGSVFFKDMAECNASLSTSDFADEMVMISGGGREEFRKMSENLEARTHETVLEVNLDSIVANFNYFRRQVPEGTGIVAMVKASAYGAGSFEIARTMQEHGAAYLAVAVLDEGIDLRRNGITMPIMVMNPKVVNYKAMFEYRLEPEIYCLGMLEDVMREARKYGVRDYPVHIKLDTGMHRMGLVEEELDTLVSLVRDSREVRISSLFTHLATADCPDMDEYTLLQLSLFEKMTEHVMRGVPYPVKRHALNSAGIVRFPQYAFDMVRLGIGLYGVNTLPPEMESPLACVSTLRTVIISIREWEAGESIGYGRKGMLERRSRIATIPIGYADGMNRHFGRGAVRLLVNGKEAPTVGNICMDACMIDVTGIDCEVGDSVEIFGREMPVDRLSDLLGTIPYEILTSVSPRVKRVYYRE